jgi:hypothetical protein
MTQLYHHHLQLAQNSLNTSTFHNIPESCTPVFFPNVLLLMINDDPWEEHPHRRDIPETPNVKWINNLI